MSLSAAESTPPNHPPSTLLDKWQLLATINADTELSQPARIMAFWLLYHHNCGTGRCDPSIPTLAAEVGVSRSTAIRAINELISAEYFTRTTRRGRNHSNTYVPALDKNVSPMTPFNAGKGVTPDIENVSPVTPKTGKKNREKNLSDIESLSTSESTTAADQFNSPEGRQAEILYPIDGGKAARDKLVRLVKGFHVNTDNAEAIVDGSLATLDAAELRRVVVQAKARGADRDQLAVIVAEAIRERDPSAKPPKPPGKHPRDWQIEDFDIPPEARCDGDTIDTQSFIWRDDVGEIVRETVPKHYPPPGARYEYDEFSRSWELASNMAI